jgi:hypothetical protein
LDQEVDELIALRARLRKAFLRDRADRLVDSVRCPVNFARLLYTVENTPEFHSSQSDITPWEVFCAVRIFFHSLETCNILNSDEHRQIYTFQLALMEWFSVARLCTKAGITRAGLAWLLRKTRRDVWLARVDPGEAVGVLAGQSIGELVTQMTLSKFIDRVCISSLFVVCVSNLTLALAHLTHLLHKQTNVLPCSDKRYISPVS